MQFFIYYWYVSSLITKKHKQLAYFLHTVAFYQARRPSYFFVKENTTYFALIPHQLN